MSVEQVAAKLDIDPLTLQFWEVGADALSRPTLVQLRKMARIYRRPLSVFYLEHPPEDISNGLVDFRLLGGGERRAWSPELHENYRRVQMQREVAIELASVSDEIPPSIAMSLSFSDNAEKAGSEIRSWLGVSLREQLNWENDYQALKAWIAAIERKDILVAQTSGIPLEEMRGFSISDQPFPMIVLNGFDTPRARIFTLLHELAHVLSQSGGLCNLKDSVRRTSPASGVEAFCNAVAAAVLLPVGAMRDELAIMGVSHPIAWSDDALLRLANQYKVSREVILRRLVTLDRATLDYYFQKLHQYSRLSESQRRRRRESRSGGPGAAVMSLRNMGRRYTAGVLQAFGERYIDAAELTEYLRIKIDQVPTLVELLDR